MTASHVALLRGINVGGGNRLPMVDLRKIADSLGWTGIRTHIASGNLVFTATGKTEALAADLSEALQQKKRLDLRIVVQTTANFRETLAACPFAPEDPRHAHVFWLLDKPRLDATLRDSLKAETEELVVETAAAYLHAPHGIGRSALAAKLDKVLGTHTTGRNLRTARAIAAMLG